MALLWNRLEARSRSEQFDENLRSTIYDAYWTLCRQWQSGEFEASDNGSPSEVRVQWDQYPIERLSLAGQAPFPIEDRQPLEAKVERMPIAPGLPLRLEMGRHLQRMLQRALGGGAAAVMEALRAQPSLQFQLTPQADAEAQQQNAHLLSNRSLQTWIHAAVRSGAVDGGALYKALKGGQQLSSFLSSTNAQADTVGQQWVAWFDEQYNQPSGPEEQAWLPSRLEYQFDAEVTAKAGSKLSLGAEEYYEGRLDWYSFAYRRPSTPGAVPHNAANTRHLLPAQVEYPGMPAARWWEMEDALVNLLAVETSATQSGRLALVEFGLMYSNDWFMLPLRVPVGGLLDIRKLEVRDVFGQWREIRHYEDSPGHGDWAFFRIADSPADERYLLLPPSVIDLKESGPVEEVYLARDEMANMVWAIEQHIPDGLDGAREGNTAALDLSTYLQALSDRLTAGSPPAPLLDNEAKTQYTLATEVPEHWIPFMPVQVDADSGAIALQRAAMPRVYPGLKIERVRPHTSVLRRGLEEGDWEAFYLFEEEVPRAGAHLRRTWQRARWHQGQVALWSGYHKQNGRGQGNSGLRFDVLGPKEGN